MVLVRASRVVVVSMLDKSRGSGMEWFRSRQKFFLLDSPNFSMGRQRGERKGARGRATGLPNSMPAKRLTRYPRIITSYDAASRRRLARVRDRWMADLFSRPESLTTARTSRWKIFQVRRSPQTSPADFSTFTNPPGIWRNRIGERAFIGPRAIPRYRDLRRQSLLERGTISA